MAVLAAAAVVLVGSLTLRQRASAGPAAQYEEQEFTLTDVKGTIEPVTYTDGDGTFTTSEISVTQNPVTPSRVWINSSTGLIRDHVFFDVSFHNGKPGKLGEDFVGTVELEESGQLLPAGDPFCQQVPGSIWCSDMVINSGTLTGAGPFNGAKVEGDNPTFQPLPPCIKWTFSAPGSPPHILIHLPSPTFAGGEATVVHGEVEACVQSVGGIAELPGISAASSQEAGRPSEGSGWSSAAYAELAGGVAAAAVLITVGGWYARRRWLR
jgi:hypothetical protein